MGPSVAMTGITLSGGNTGVVLATIGGAGGAMGAAGSFVQRNGFNPANPCRGGACLVVAIVGAGVDLRRTGGAVGFTSFFQLNGLYQEEFAEGASTL